MTPLAHIRVSRPVRLASSQGRATVSIPVLDAHPSRGWTPAMWTRELKRLERAEAASRYAGILAEGEDAPDPRETPAYYAGVHCGDLVAGYGEDDNRGHLMLGRLMLAALVIVVLFGGAVVGLIALELVSLAIEALRQSGVADAIAAGNAAGWS